jgi:hypothetical protein
MSDFWNNIQNAEFTNEASVETRLVIPLLHALGYDNNDISPKYSVTFQEGGRGRKHEADFVVFDASTHNVNTSLIVIEAKAPNKLFNDDAKKQAESYARNVLAPFILLTDGKKLEIWQLQPTQESECVLTTSIEELCSVRGKIETLLVKDAVVKYKRSLPHKSIVAVTGDFEAYYLAELNRLSKYQHVIERTLSDYGGNKQATYDSNQLLSCFTNGAIILAASGLGKTTLSHFLLLESIKNCKASQNQSIPFDIPLPDLAETKLSIIEFIRQRIEPHHRGITEASLKDLLREKSAVLLCDGFDRLSNEQKRITAELNNLLRDFPKLQLFVFSRSSIKPELSLPLLELKPLTPKQQYVFLKSDISLLHVMPSLLQKLCEHPLLLQRLLEYWQQEKKLPSKIEELFRFWLDKLLRNIDDIKSIDREDALGLLAKATLNKPINKIDAVRLLRQNNFPDNTFDELLQCDAIRIDGSVLELQHEALADYLRALDLISSNEEKVIIQSLLTVPLKADSFFPILLMELLPSRNLQQILWKRLAEVGISVYLNALRYRADVTEEMIKATSDDLGFQYLEDLIEGIEFPLNGFFPQLRDVVIEQVIGTQQSEIAITGWVCPNPAQVEFVFHPLENTEKKVTISTHKTSHWVNLEALQYRLDSGQLLGAKHLKESLLEVVKNRRLKGGEIWIEERLMGHLRYLMKEYGFLQINETDSLNDLEELLTPHSEKVVLSGYLNRRPKFHIKTLLEDITYLKEQGKTTLDWWWLRLGWKNEMTTSDDVMAQVLNEHFRRLQLAYKEIVENSFSSITEEFGFYYALPVRWNLAVIKAGHTSLRYQWLPVKHWDEIGADTEFANSHSQVTRLKSFDTLETDVNEKLAKLGRTRCRSFTWGGHEIMSNFSSGYDLMGRFDGETQIVREVCDLISRDIEQIFSDLPSCD